MKQNLYMCCRCGREQRTQVESADAPLGWALLTFQREYVKTEGERRQLERESLTTHACGSCCDEVLAFLEKSTPSVDRAFDDGGVS